MTPLPAVGWDQRSAWSLDAFSMEGYRSDTKTPVQSAVFEVLQRTPNMQYLGENPCTASRLLKAFVGDEAERL